jgi:hypothetical protein
LRRKKEKGFFLYELWLRGFERESSREGLRKIQRDWE